jgi:hypothetical protein
MSVSDELISLVSKSAPLVGTVLGSPLAGIAISLLASFFGAKTGDLSDLLSKIQNDPEAALKLKTLQFQHEETLKQIASNDFQKSIDDKESARAMQEEYIARTGHTDPMLPFLVILLFFSIFSIIFSFIYFSIAPDIKTVLVMVLTILIREIPDIYKLYFGASDDDTNPSA